MNHAEQQNDPSYDQALKQLDEARQQYEIACLSVWHAAEREHPEIAIAIRRLGWDDSRAAMFLCTPHKRWSTTPAAIVQAGKGDELIDLVEKVLAGVF